ncbi:MAG TPA: M50 family metallopeptidase [Candidatus Limnocylindrales bacterium]|nr:M50 family metallopeptidase [Candidatus Limnocylindrales bacterium]
MFVLDSIVTVALMLAILVVLVVVHEVGHFIAARRAGVLVHEFGIGFPPRARVLGRDRETLYTLNWLPIGGFVRLEGEDGDSDDPRSFVRQSLRVRIVILLAGVVMNFALAWLIFGGIAGVADPSVTVPIHYVQPGSPAAAAGLVGAADASDGTPVRTGDTILAIDGRRFAYFDLLREDPLAWFRQHPGQSVTISVARGSGGVDEVTVTLRPANEISTERGALGIVAAGRGLGEDIERSPLEAVGVGWQRTVDASLLVLNALRDLFGQLDDPQVSGPIGIANAVGTIRSQLPPVFLLYLVGLLSANLAVINVLPLPPMDGGRIAVSLIKAVAGGRISLAAERATYLVGFVLLFALLIWISLFDIQRLGT